MVKTREDVEHEHIEEVPFRVEIEYAGAIYKLSNYEGCKQWIDQVNAMSTLEHAHGIKPEDIPWKVYKKLTEEEKKEAGL